MGVVILGDVFGDEKSRGIKVYYHQQTSCTRKLWSKLNGGNLRISNLVLLQLSPFTSYRTFPFLFLRGMRKKRRIWSVKFYIFELFPPLFALTGATKCEGWKILRKSVTWIYLWRSFLLEMLECTRKILIKILREKLQPGGCDLKGKNWRLGPLLRNSILVILVSKETDVETTENNAQNYALS